MTSRPIEMPRNLQPPLRADLPPGHPHHLGAAHYHRLPPPPHSTSRRRMQRLWFGLVLAGGITAGALASLVLLPVDGGSTFDRQTAAPVTGTDAGRDVALSRATLLALNDAVHTGDFAVLRGRAAPAFQTDNPTEKLARIFAGLARASVDLSAVAATSPRWSSQPGVGADGLLRIAGTYPITRHTLAFVLAYADIAGEWRLMELTVEARPDRTAELAPAQ